MVAALMILVALSFPIALLLIRIFDVTPHGVVVRSAIPTAGLSRGHKLDVVSILMLRPLSIAPLPRTI